MNQYISNIRSNRFGHSVRVIQKGRKPFKGLL